MTPDSNTGANSLQYQRPAQVAANLGISEKTLWKWVKAGKLPRQIHLSPRVSVFCVAEVQTAVKAMQKAA